MLKILLAALAVLVFLVSCDDPIALAPPGSAPAAPAASAVPASSLAALSVSTGSLSPAFDPNVTSYSVQVPNNVTSVSLTPQTASAGASYTQTGGSGFVVGANTVILRVRGADGSVMVYTVVVVRDFLRTSTSGLSGLSYTFSGGGSLSPPFVPSLSPAFSPTTLSYTTVVPHSVTGITLVSSQLDTLATVSAQVGGTNLVDGVNPPATLTVTSADGTTTTTYKVTVDRWPFDVGLPSGNSTLTGSGFSTAITPAGAFSVSPAFSPGTTSYLISVPAATTSVALTPTVATGATMTMKKNSATTVNPAGGVYNVTMAANTGTSPAFTPVKLTVLAPDGVLTSTYNLMIQQNGTGAGAILSSDSSLAALSVGVGATNYPLSPAFASGTTAYSVNLPAGATALTVAASKNNANASTPVVVGATGLVTGANNVSVTVTAQDGTSTVYSIIANVPSSLSNVSTLGSLSVGAATLSPTFASGTTAYTLSGVAAGTTSLAVTASATDANATVAITGNSGLVVGANTITVVCTAQDGVTKTTYTLSVTIAAGGGGGGGGKSFSPTAKLTVSATYGGTDHAAFWIWISDSTGAYVETLSLYGQGGTPTKPPSGGLPAVWTTAKGSTAAATNNGVDAVTAATWATGGSYVATHTQPWTFKNSAGTVLTQGTYTFHIEVHEMNGAGGSYSLPVTLGSSAVTQTFTSNAVLSAGSVNYTP